MTDDVVGLMHRRRSLAPSPESARLARDDVVAALADAGRSDLTDIASLLVSELVTNAIVHARTPILLEVLAGRYGLHVAVHDESPTLPQQRHYGEEATTGRGMTLLERMADRHGADREREQGKVVWFELGSTVAPAPVVGADLGPVEAVDEVTVTLQDLPLGLARAWQQQADTLLREYVLSQWDPDSALPPGPADQGAAHDALAAAAAAIDHAAADHADPAALDVTLTLARPAVADFDELDLLLEHVLALAERGQTLAPPTQPELRAFRRWMVEQVREQAAGGVRRGWPGLSALLPVVAAPAVDWDTSAVTSSPGAVVAADDLNRIVAASPAALDLLGWDESLLGQRVVAVVPARHREAHIAAFALNLLTGEGHIIDQEITVPALRRDGTEVEVRLCVRREVVGAGRTAYTATMRPA